jgi:hypothetical protein
MLGGIPKETGVPSGTAEIIFLDSISGQQFLEFIGKTDSFVRLLLSPDVGDGLAPLRSPYRESPLSLLPCESSLSPKVFMDPFR